MKIANWILAVLFALFAVVQYNDPDALLWVLLYGLVAAVAVGAALGRHNAWGTGVLTAAYLLGVFYLAPSVLEWLSSDASLITGMSAERMYVEESRECLGLLMAAVALGFFFWQARRVEAMSRL
ncbi:transmembrane 220 family protein [Catalinimonas alkaloidigena]|nr:transmembrane 220 family protein [Catalinimonas alkaloidigena]